MPMTIEMPMNRNLSHRAWRNGVVGAFLIAGMISMTLVGCSTTRFDYSQAMRWPADGLLTKCRAIGQTPQRGFTLTNDYAKDCPVQEHHFYIKERGQKPQRVEYRLGFLEFNAKGRILSPHQRDQVLAAVTGIGWPKSDHEAVLVDQGLPEKRFAVIYVHGWRNNASDDTPNPHRFQTALAYFASFIHQRCAGKCRPRVTGIYVGWPGAKINENVKRDGLRVLDQRPNLPTVLSFGPVFETSNRIGPYVVAELKRLIREVKAHDENESLTTRVLVLGHSAGSNLLFGGLSGLKGDTSYDAGYGAIRPGSELDKALAAHREHQVLEPVLGDLVVLFAPASPASRWVALQRRQLDEPSDPLEKMRFRAETNPCQSVGCKFREFPRHQRPVLISITSDCEVGIETRSGRSSFDCDKAVYRAFDLHQVTSDPLRLLSGDPKRQERQAIAYYSKDAWTKQGGLFAPFGPSHVVTDSSGNDRGRLPTSLGSLENPAASACVQAGPWLQAARHIRSDIWDTSPPPRDERNASRQQFVAKMREFNAETVSQLETRDFALINNEGTRVQWIFSHSGVPRASRKTIRAMTDSNTPFWNTIAHMSVMGDHGGFYSYPLLCSLTQLWLDPVVLDLSVNRY
jgi:hypothetical protein